jgi:hypothetical protein
VRVLRLPNKTCSECPFDDAGELAVHPSVTVVDVGIYRIQLCDAHLRELKSRIAKRAVVAAD